MSITYQCNGRIKTAFAKQDWLENLRDVDPLEVLHTGVHEFHNLKNCLNENWKYITDNIFYLHYSKGQQLSFEHLLVDK